MSFRPMARNSQHPLSVGLGTVFFTVAGNKQPNQHHFPRTAFISLFLSPSSHQPQPLRALEKMLCSHYHDSFFITIAGLKWFY